MLQFNGTWVLANERSNLGNNIVCRSSDVTIVLSPNGVAGWILNTISFPVESYYIEWELLGTYIMRFLCPTDPFAAPIDFEITTINTTTLALRINNAGTVLHIGLNY